MQHVHVVHRSEVACRQPPPRNLKRWERRPDGKRSSIGVLPALEVKVRIRFPGSERPADARSLSSISGIAKAKGRNGAEGPLLAVLGR